MNSVTGDIYIIRNFVTKKIYIGQSINALHRLSRHRSLLYRSKHFNADLQADWDKYGYDCFGFSVIMRRVPKDKLDDMEYGLIGKILRYTRLKLYNTRIEKPMNKLSTYNQWVAEKKKMFELIRE